MRCRTPTTSASPSDWLPKAVLDDLPALDADLAGLVRLHSSEHPAEDGSERLLLALADGQTWRRCCCCRAPGLCVHPGGLRGGLPVLHDRPGGLLRQLGSAEIVAQVALARALRPVRKVVFMGMGEPAHNLDNVLEAIELLGTVGGIGHKNLVFSTVGDARVFERLPCKGRVRPALALSLHTTMPRRAQLLPRAPQARRPPNWWPAADAYARATGYPVQYQWTLLDGVNDGDDEVEGIARLLRGRFGDAEPDPVEHARWTPACRSSAPAGSAPPKMARQLTLHRARHPDVRCGTSAGQAAWSGGCGTSCAAAPS
jgi:23S rRNA (adenine2503-C2)-methyltransferase